MKTAVVNLRDIVNSGMILSAEFHINRIKNKKPYRLVKNKYEPVKNPNGKEIYLSSRQVFEINNLLFAIKEIKKEIKKIIKDDAKSNKRK
jgi:hypothetical protein